MNFKTSFKLKLQQQKFDFDEQALLLFRYQAEHNPIYKDFLRYLNIQVDEIQFINQIPFLPIEFFKTQKVETGNFDAEVVFKSSGTTLQSRSQHFVASLAWYQLNSRIIFEQFYGSLTDYVVLALLPSYLEQGDSSLVAMVEYFITQTGQEQEGFYLHDHAALLRSIRDAKQKQKKVLLIGVSYALLDLAESVGGLEDFSGVIVMETGGMKGRRREMIREELHSQLKHGLGVDTIHSEYGMTELLSQGYSKGNGIFEAGSTMKILLRDLNDPLAIDGNLRSGGINVIDLGNIDSCAFIETKDIGKLYTDGSFEVLGRFDNSDIRGCNLMIG